MMRFVPSLGLVLLGLIIVLAHLLTGWFELDASLPVLVGEVPLDGTSAGTAIAEAGALIVVHLVTWVVAPAAVGAGILDACIVLASRWVSRDTGAKGPTPKPVGSTGGGL